MGGEDGPVCGWALRVGVHRLAGAGTLVASLLDFSAVRRAGVLRGSAPFLCGGICPGMILERAAALGGAPSGRWGFAARENLYPRPRADAVENLVHSALVARNDLQHAPVEELVFGFPRVVVVAAAGVGDDLKFHPGRVAGGGPEGRGGRLASAIRCRTTGLRRFAAVSCDGLALFGFAGG